MLGWRDSSVIKELKTNRPEFRSPESYKDRQGSIHLLSQSFSGEIGDRTRRMSGN